MPDAEDVLLEMLPSQDVDDRDVITNSERHMCEVSDKADEEFNSLIIINDGCTVMD